MTPTRAQWARTHRTGDRTKAPEAQGELRPDELERIQAARAALAASGVRVSLRNAIRTYRLGALDLDGVAVLTMPDRHGSAVPVDLMVGETVASRLSRGGGASE